MTRFRHKTSVAPTALVSLLVVGSLSACAATGPIPVSITDAPMAAEHSSILDQDLPDGLSAQGVVLAAILLSTADISAAVAEGLVTPAEIDAATRAIEDGSLDFWRQRAEADLRAERG